MIYKNALITTHEKQFLGWIDVNEKGIIVEIGKGKTKKQGLDCQGNILLPTFIDGHTHGGYGLSFDDILEQNWTSKVADYERKLLKEGVSAVFATTVTQSENHLLLMAEKFQALIKQYSQTFLNWYLEGPFISHEKKGAHKAEYIKPLTQKFLNQLVKKMPTKKMLLLVAPEIAKNYEIVQQNLQQLKFAIGHSNAYDVKNQHLIDYYYTRMTHLYNGMSTFDHKRQSLVNTILEKQNISPKYLVEIIADGIHVNNSTLKFTYDNININNLIVVSDSLHAKGLKDDFYKLGELDIVKKKDIFYLKDQNTLAGSGKPYNLILENFKLATNCSWEDIVKVSSYNLAKNLKITKNYGTIKINQLANFVLINPKFKILLINKFGAETILKKI
ncbi:amidohydrolase family protein [Candidatus Mycoplasma pogonae]